MALLGTYRRYCQRMRLNARFMLDGELEGVWRSKQESQPGTLLPAAFPYLSQLADSGYTTREDLAGADRLELTTLAGLSPRDADDVLQAYSLLPPL